jgi:hypothetical protein
LGYEIFSNISILLKLVDKFHYIIYKHPSWASVAIMSEQAGGMSGLNQIDAAQLAVGLGDGEGFDAQRPLFELGDCRQRRTDYTLFISHTPINSYRVVRVSRAAQTVHLGHSALNQVLSYHVPRAASPPSGGHQETLGRCGYARVD